MLAGPLAAATLADLAATAIKVERPGAGDDTRSWGPPFVDRTAAYFDCANRSKQGVTLGLGDPADAALARELAARADNLIENFKPGSLARHGLDRATVLAADPGLVHCSITGFGTGSVTLTATPDRPPVAPPRLGEHNDAVRAWLSGPAVEPFPAVRDETEPDKE